MRHVRRILLATLVLCAMGSGNAAASTSLFSPDNALSPMPALPARASAPPAWAMSAAAALSTDQRVGQVIVGGFDGQRVPAFVRSALARDQMAGVILFGYNVGDRRQLTALTKSLRTAARGGALVSVDQEGGLVRRIPYARPRAAQPAQGSVASVRRVAADGARDLRALGFNLNFAPVADVPSSREAELAGRAFAGSPSEVGRKVAAAVEGYRSGRVAATVKHFPGLGAAARNTDDAAVVIRRSRAQLNGADLQPFRAAVAARTPLVMASHALFPALDRTRLASQSPAILNGLLRRSMGYGGVVVTDALEARAVLSRSGVATAAERSLAAGNDLLLATRPASYGPIRKRLLARASTSTAIRTRLTESAARVLVLKRSLGLRLPAPR